MSFPATPAIPAPPALKILNLTYPGIQFPYPYPFGRRRTSFAELCLLCSLLLDDAAIILETMTRFSPDDFIAVDRDYHTLTAQNWSVGADSGVNSRLRIEKRAIIQTIISYSEKWYLIAPQLRKLRLDAKNADAPPMAKTIVFGREIKKFRNLCAHSYQAPGTRENGNFDSGAVWTFLKGGLPGVFCELFVLVPRMRFTLMYSQELLDDATYDRMLAGYHRAIAAEREKIVAARCRDGDGVLPCEDEDVVMGDVGDERYAALFVMLCFWCVERRSDVNEELELQFSVFLLFRGVGDEGVESGTDDGESAVEDGLDRRMFRKFCF